MNVSDIILDVLTIILLIVCSIIGFIQNNITAGLGWAVATLTLIRVILIKSRNNEY